MKDNESNSAAISLLWHALPVLCRGQFNMVDMVGNVKIVLSEQIALLLHPHVDIPFSLVVRGRSQLSTFMKAYTAYARGEGVWDHRTLFPENQHLFLITDNVL